MKITKLTPLEELIAEKRELRSRLRVQEEKLNDDFSYVRQHAGSLFLSGLSLLFFPSSSEDTEKNDSSSGSYFSVFKAVMPFVWEAAVPILIRWFIKKVTSLFRKKSDVSS
ncbi:hypothetical protein [uncultured Sanguibacteroides sp.]|uniref:hypothetical protein n=1 Tax=uncultured Sanguibacteroides sp. TaxID=1635151 RepID=UPI0025D10810|nr:hypothetical protein [uncultured Sanguibacteroides sp.]